MIPVSVVEGDEVTLTCKTTCSLTDTPAFTWNKNRRPLFSVNSSNLLRLPSVSQMDAGDYRCGVQGQSYRSPAVTLDVQCKYRFIYSLIKLATLKVHAESTCKMNPISNQAVTNSKQHKYVMISF